jgi:hypothetical protein
MHGHFFTYEAQKAACFGVNAMEEPLWSFLVLIFKIHGADFIYNEQM